jgi:DNA processing protein
MTYEIRDLEYKDFPEGLLHIPDVPKKLRIAGTLTENEVFLCVVGSRKHSHYGAEICEKLISSLKGLPVAIVSGMALGVDSIAHKTAIETRLKTIAFPGSGLSRDKIYPRNHLRLADRIVESGGALISEFEDNFGAAPWAFPRRNRLMAGISNAVLVIEAEKKSGTLITARLATEYNRDVLAVPGNISSPLSQGPNLLIRLGATPITEEKDLLEALGFEPADLETRNLFEDLEDDEKKIAELLTEPQTRDELADKTKMAFPQLSATLSMLELKGIIKESGGKIYLV